MAKFYIKLIWACWNLYVVYACVYMGMCVFLCERETGITCPDQYADPDPLRVH